MVVLSAVGIGGVVKSGDVRWLFISLPFILLLFALSAFAPAGYRLAPDGVHVERRAWNVVIPYRRIRGVDQAPRSVAGISMFGSQRVFGRFGSFWNMRLGFYRLYLANRTGIVWLATDRGWVGLSPDRPDEFVTRLHTHLT